jgi:tetratricopeptide (TPR) repeat protein
MKKLFILFSIISCGLTKTFYAQNQKKMDSLQSLLNAAKDDTTRLRIYIALCFECDMKDNLKYGGAAVTLADNMLSKTNDDNLRKSILKRKAEAFKYIGVFYKAKGDTSKILEYFQKQALISQEIKDSLGIVRSFSDFGEYYHGLGNIPKAIAYFQKALALARDGNYKQQIAICLYQMGFLYKEQDYKPQALENFQKGLALLYELKDTALIMRAFLEIGILYGQLHDTTKAMEYFNKAILRIEKNRLKLTAWIYKPIGDMYSNIHDVKALNKALEYYKKGLSIEEEENNKLMICILLRRMGSVYRNLSDYDKALDYTSRSLKIAEELKDKGGIAWAYYNLAKTYGKQKNYKKAKDYSDKALAMMKKNINVSDICELEELTAKIDSSCGNYKEAYGHFQQYIILRDQLNSKEISKAAAQQKFQEEADKQKAEQEKKDAIAAAESRKQKVITGSVIAGLLLVLVFAIFVLRSLSITRKQKVVIEQKSKETEEQKQLIEEKQHEIIDSITYAKRLQQAILPSLAAVKEQLPNSFVYYQPKDIVAGDFYWMHTTPLSGGRGVGGEVVYIAAADCTGHGVPGAMVSVVCSNALNRAVNEFNLTDTGLILDKTRELVIETFEKSDAEVKDGMDISLMRIEFPSPLERDGRVRLQWSGANNSLWYVLNDELIEVKADKQPIGKYSEEKPFTTNNIILPPSLVGRAGEGCTFYLFSDGYADQFSPDDKKLMKKKFKDIVLSIQNLPMEEQKNYLEKYHNDWKANMEQTDDVLVIGVRV